MKKDKLFLGTTKSDNTKLYITKHNWDCGWYWGFGYIGNESCHMHFDSYFLNKSVYNASDLFHIPRYNDKNWWIIRDYFVQAYALKACAEIYQYGGNQTTIMGITDIIKNKEMADKLNADLKLVLDTLWQFLIDNNGKK